MTSTTKALFCLLAVLTLPVGAQERVTPAQSRGGKELPEAWAEPPAAWKDFPFPEWKLPTDLATWQRQRTGVLHTVNECLGEMPKRPDPEKVKTLSREDRGDYWLERFEFHNGIDSLVPGILLLPKTREQRVPAIIGLHGHGGSAETICSDLDNAQCVGPALARKGYVVAAIDTYFCGARNPRGRRDHETPERYRGADEGTLFRINLWFGRTLWGLMHRDQQCLIDYLQTRPEVDPDTIGVTGMSMGGTGSWWLAALAERIMVAVGVAGFTRYEQLLAIQTSRLHGVYYFVPGLLKHFDTEAVYSLVAPRPMLMLSGDRDAGLPLAGIEILERKLQQMYSLYEKADAFHSVVYRNTAHEYLPEMQAAMLQWFQRHLPVSDNTDKSASFRRDFELPEPLPAIRIPRDNPSTAPKVALGRNSSSTLGCRVESRSRAQHVMSPTRDSAMDSGWRRESMDEWEAGTCPASSMSVTARHCSGTGERLRWKSRRCCRFKVPQKWTSRSTN
jgi:dienelactone hydrolase